MCGKSYAPNPSLHESQMAKGNNNQKNYKPQIKLRWQSHPTAYFIIVLLLSRRLRYYSLYIFTLTGVISAIAASVHFLVEVEEKDDVCETIESRYRIGKQHN